MCSDEEEDEGEAEKFEAVNTEFQKYKRMWRLSGGGFCFNRRVEKKPHLDPVTNTLTRDSANIGQIREDK